MENIGLIPVGEQEIPDDPNGSDFTIAGVGSFGGLIVSGISTLGITSATNFTTQNLIVSGITTVGLASTSSPSNSQMSFELTNDTTLTIRVRGSDGVVRSGIVTLS